MTESDAQTPGPRPEQGLRIRGTREGLTIALGAGDLAALLDSLEQHLRTQGAFFRGGRVALESYDWALGRDTIERVRELLQQYDMILRTVVTDDPTTREAGQALGLRIVAPPSGEVGAPAPTVPAAGREAEPALAPPVAVAPAPAPTAPLGGTAAQDAGRAILIQRVIRSGQTVRHTGHVVVIGDVNPGAAVVAGGHIIVWGRLQGMAHAGSMGDESACVCAVEMAPTQLRIGTIIARPEDVPAPVSVKGQPSSYAEIARVRDGIIVVDPWDKVSRGA